MADAATANLGIEIPMLPSAEDIGKSISSMGKGISDSVQSLTEKSSKKWDSMVNGVMSMASKLEAVNSKTVADNAAREKAAIVREKKLQDFFTAKLAPLSNMYVATQLLGEQIGKYNEGLVGTLNSLIPPTLKNWFQREEKDKEKDKKVKKEWYKIITHKWFDKALGFLSGFGESIFDILLGVLLLTLFDPSGSLIISIINFLTNMLLWGLQILINIIPPAIATVWNKILPMVGKALHDFFPKLVKLITDSLDAIGGDSLFLKGVVSVLKWLVSGPVLKGLQIAADNIKLIALAAILNKFGILKMITPLLFKLGSRILPLLWTGIKLLGSGLLALGQFIVTGIINILPILWEGLMLVGSGIVALGQALLTFLFTNPIGWIILGIIALTVALLALWKYSDKVTGFFEGIYDWFTHLSKAGKLLVVALSIILFPLTAFIGLIWGLAQLFQDIKKEGFVGGLKIFFKRIGKFLFTLIISPVLKWLKKVSNSIIDFFDEIENFFRGDSVIARIFKWVANMFKSFMNIGSTLLNVSGLDEFGKKLKEVFEGFIKWIMDTPIGKAYKFIKDKLTGEDTKKTIETLGIGKGGNEVQTGLRNTLAKVVKKEIDGTTSNQLLDDLAQAAAHKGIIKQIGQGKDENIAEERKELVDAIQGNNENIVTAIGELLRETKKGNKQNPIQIGQDLFTISPQQQIGLVR